MEHIVLSFQLFPIFVLHAYRPIILKKSLNHALRRVRVQFGVCVGYRQVQIDKFSLWVGVRHSLNLPAPAAAAARCAFLPLLPTWLGDGDEWRWLDGAADDYCGWPASVDSILVRMTYDSRTSAWKKLHQSSPTYTWNTKIDFPLCG